ncbi:hypothetical protein FQB35_13030 [Crassaminicella thermophila]|uniref:Flavoprotein n=1 Tax=Crassaminicella thermophila TaxID=2599308 RepID=A0A5C0SEV2_CRATE|nr:hypothetical protein [Crassaminicella thermophila]QEK13165.1 hypothetical protein FQB35_13030 [Crassaminicella thermophila]
MKGNALVKEVLDGIIKGLEKEEVKKRKKEISKINNIFMVFTGKNEEINSIKKLKENDIDVSIILSEKTKDILEKELLKNRINQKDIYTKEDIQIIEKIDILWVPVFTQNMAAKLRFGMQDTIDTFVIWQALWHGKKVIANKEYLQYCNGKDTKNTYLKKIVHENIQFLEKLGVKWGKYYDCVKALKSIDEKQEKRKIITKKDILELVGKTDKYYLSKNSIITPLAKDIAKEKNILLIKD